MDYVSGLMKNDSWVRQQVALRLSFDRTWALKPLVRELMVAGFYDAALSAAGSGKDNEWH
jgi:hypothetical protein